MQLPFGLIEPFGIWLGLPSASALSDRLTGSDPSLLLSAALQPAVLCFVDSTAAPLPPFGLIEPFGIGMGRGMGRVVHLWLYCCHKAL
jgi:hypothetical protein